MRCTTFSPERYPMSKRLTPEEKLEKLQKQQAQIKEQIKARDARERTKERKLDTRRKVILGALIQTHITKNPNDPTAKLASRLIDEYVIGNKERELFDLEPLPEPEQETRKTRHKKENEKTGTLSEQF